ncbi:hypothetical protein ACRN98_17975 [Shewanella oncorhynchi]|uniref:hypothetical protein n=1 Tax=Shewanella TaxID=22 RepID=UPI0021D92210|nr:hypothetical protein [Shewanella sp. SM69]MCU8040395.1 hypothetical protein [Shewanella sp. SM69]
MPNDTEVIIQLKEAYLDILSKTDFSKIYASPGLSGIFLACPDKSYFEAKRKVLFIGQEPKTWRTNCPIKNGAEVTQQLIQQAMSQTVHQSKLPSGKHKLLNFYHKCSLALSEGQPEIGCSAVYSNQFCMSLQRRSPERSPAFKMIEELSNSLLEAQFTILKPDIAIFTTGSNRDKYIKNALNYSTVEVVVPRKLWHFQVNETHCFRINHPSARQSRKLELSDYQDGAIERAKLYVPIRY